MRRDSEISEIYCAIHRVSLLPLTIDIPCRVHHAGIRKVELGRKGMY